MGSERFPLQNKGIFRNLPTFSPEITGLTAIVTGANGISGFNTIRALLESPDRWKKVWAVSRRPPPKEVMNLLSEDQQSKLEHVACDFLDEPKDIATCLREKGVTGDYVFFYLYAQPKAPDGELMWSNAQEMCNVNSALMRNFTDALDLARIVPKRFLLQTGAKNYGVHIGRARTPYVESDPRIELEPNFYYLQEDILWEFCRKHGIGWNVICPPAIIGATRNAAMNTMYPLAVYAAVQAQKGEKLAYPGDIDAWGWTTDHATAMLTGFLCEWAVLEDKCANHKFNATNTSPLPMNRLWPEVGRWFGCKEIGRPELEDFKFTVIDGGDAPTPLGYGGNARVRSSFTFADWSSQPENRAVWADIAKENNLVYDPFDDIASWQCTDIGTWMLGGTVSMNKAANLGWTGHVDTLESLHLVYKELSAMGMLPPMVAEARPLQ